MSNTASQSRLRLDQRAISVSRALFLVACIAVVSSVACRRRASDSQSQGAPSGSVSGASSSSFATAASGALPRFERFLDARPRDDGAIDLAGVTRDGAIVVASIDASLGARGVLPLASNFVATEDTTIALAPGGLVVVTGRLGDATGTFLLGTALTAPRALGDEWCIGAGGVSWLLRDGTSIRAHVMRTQSTLGALGALDADSGAIEVPLDVEAHLACGPDALVVSVRDGEDLSIARLHPGTPSFTSPALIEIERENELDDELRDRRVIARAGDEVVIVRVGESKVSLRVLPAGASAPTPWTVVATTPEGKKKARDFRLDGDADVVDVQASPSAAGEVWLLTSEPIRTGKACNDGDPSRRIVLHAITPGSPGAPRAMQSAHPIVELACGVEAIAAHLTADATVAHLWWTEPVADGSCAFPGLTVGAVVDAVSDKPGARRIAFLAEGVARAGEGRFVGVVREGSCAPYDAPGNGGIAWAK